MDDNQSVGPLYKWKDRQADLVSLVQLQNAGVHIPVTHICKS